MNTFFFMSKLRLLFFGFLATALSPQVFAQFGDCLYQHDLEQPTELIHEVKLPPTAFAKTGGDRYNFRVYGVAASGDTLEMPWAYPNFLRSSPPLLLKPINAGKTSQGDRFTYESESYYPIQSLKLDLRNSDFEGIVTLEGADKLGDWQTVLSNYRIIDLSKNGGPYRFTTLKFSPSIYRYYRITIAGVKDVDLRFVEEGATSRTMSDTLLFDSNFKVLPELAKLPKTSIYEVNLSNEVLIDQIHFKVADTLQYVRKVEVQILLDSFKQADEVKYRYRTVGSGALSSVEPAQTIRFTARVARHFRILIHDQDNEPLTIEGVSAGVHEPRINVRLSGAERYFLAFGCKSLFQRRPNYDITQDLASLNERPPVLKLAPLNSFVSPVKSAEGLFSNSLWLYGALVLVAGLLGWMAIGMMKK